MNKKGFTLFEVLIAMTIMSSAAVLLVLAWGGNQARVRKMTINNQAAFLLDEIMSELENKYKRRITQLPENEEGSFDHAPDFTWAMESKDFEMPDLSALMKSQGDDNGLMLMVVDKLTEHLNESIKEMKVTIVYTRGKKSVKYSATTFLVDYDKPLPLSLPGGGGGLGQ